MLDILGHAVHQHADLRWKVTLSHSAEGYRVHVDLGNGVTFVGKGESVEQAEAEVTAKIDHWENRIDGSAQASDLEVILQASIAHARRQRRARTVLRVIRGGKKVT